MSIFDVDPGVLGRFRSVEGTQFMAALLRCEAYRARIPLQHVVISTTQITTKDGGIDAKVIGQAVDGTLLGKGGTYFQIKTGTAFKPWLIGHLIKELFGRDGAQPLKKNLGKELRRCFSQKRKYVIVTLGHDPTPEQHTSAVTTVIELLQRCGYASPKVDVVGQGQIVALLSQYPSLCLELNGIGSLPFLTHASLAARVDLSEQIHIGNPQQKFIDELRSAWRSNEFQHVRIVGEPGIGKTRLVVEAARQADLSPTVVYIPHAEDFQTSGLFNELLKPDRRYSVSLVIDECKEEERASIWGALKGKSQIKLITLDHGPETSVQNSMRVLNCPPLDDDQIQSILADYIGQSPHLRNWVDWCQGSPRVAHAVGSNLARNSGDILKSPDTVPIWERFVVGGQQTTSAPAQEALMVFRYVSLFERFGFEDPVAEEGRFIASLVQQADPRITWPRFQSIVRSLKSRRILQGRHTLFIVPKALHVRFWVDYWDEYGRDFDFDNFYRDLPQGLKSWFLQLFKYAHKSPVALGVVRQILSLTDGPYSRPEFVKSKTGCALLAYIAEAAPAETLSVIEQSIGTWRQDELLSWSEGRSEIVWALGKLAVWQELFTRVALVLKRLALAENSHYGNNSRGTLISLFMIGEGWAATTAPPSTRLPVLKAMLESEDESEFSLALDIAKEWLETYGGSRTIGPEYQGLRPPIQFWKPKFYKEIYGPWRDVWRLLHGAAKRSRVSRKHATYALMANRAISLLQWRELQGEILDTLFEVAADSEADKGTLLTATINALTRPKKAYSAHVLKRLVSLDKTLTGNDFWGKVERYVLSAVWFDYDRDSSLDSPQMQRDKMAFKKLVSSSARDIRIVERHLNRLLTTNSGNQLARFGTELAKTRRDNSLDEPLMAAIISFRGTHSLFAAGYLAGVCELDLPRYEQLALRLLSSSLHPLLVANCIRWATLSDRIVDRLLLELQNGSIVEHVFESVGLARSEGKISLDRFEAAIEALLVHGTTTSLSLAIRNIDAVYCQRANDLVLPIDSTWRAIELVAKSEDDPRGDQMREFYLYRVAEKYIRQHPNKQLELLGVILSNLSSISRLRSPNDIGRLADEIIKLDPHGAWTRVASNLDASGAESTDLIAWLGDSNQAHAKQPGAMRWLMVDDVMEWLERDPGARARRIYRGLPKTLLPSAGGEITARFIERFRADHGLSVALTYHFLYGESWMGPRSVMIRSKRDEARSWLELPLVEATRTWVSSYISMLSDEIARSEIEEERDIFA